MCLDAGKKVITYPKTKKTLQRIGKRIQQINLLGKLQRSQSTINERVAYNLCDIFYLWLIVNIKYFL